MRAQSPKHHVDKTVEDPGLSPVELHRDTSVGKMRMDMK